MMELKSGTYYFKVAGFSSDNDCVQMLRYAGPDTGSRQTFVNAIGIAVKPA
jgi:hypothetical protein